MNPQESAQALLAAEDADARQALLIPRQGDFYVAVIEHLKDESDRESLRDPHAALLVTDVAAQVADHAALPRCRALADWARSNVLLQLCEYVECLRLIRQAIEVYTAEGMELEVARLSSNRALIMINTGRYDEGLEAAQTALAVLRQHPPSPSLGSVLNALGLLYGHLGRHEEALAAYDESAQVCVTLDDAVNGARVTVNKAYALEGLDRFDEATVLLQQARAVLVEHGCSLEVARTDLNLGITYTRIGRYDEALGALDRAAGGFAALENPAEVAVVGLYRADLYAEFNLYDELLKAPVHDWQWFEEREMQWQAARARLHRGVAHRHLGHVAQAGELLAAARSAFARVGDPIWTRLADLEQVLLWCQVDEWARALPAAIETAEYFREKHMPIREAASDLQAARCLLALERPEEAAARYRRVLDLARELDVPPLLYRAHHGLGRVAEQQGGDEEAREHYRQAVEVIEGLRQRLRVEDFRVGFLEDKLHVYRDAVLLCLRTGQEDEAFAYVERAKSGALVDLLLANAGRAAADGESVGEDVLARLDELREQLNWHYSKLEGGEEQERGGVYEETGAWQRVNAIEQQAIQLWRRLQQDHPFYASLDRADLDPLSTTRDCLRGNEVLLHYYVAGDTIHVFVAGRDELRACLPLPGDARQVIDTVAGLDTILRGASGLDDDYVSTALEPLARQALGWLYEDLFQSLVPFLDGVERVLVAPDGALFQVPFHALHNGGGYLADRYEMAYTPSAGTLRLCRENRRRCNAGSGRALVVGYSNDGALPHVMQEIDVVARAVPGATIISEEDASLARLQEHAGSSALLHLATHAVFRHDNPLFSALQLAGGEWLRAMDLYTLRLNGALVTLSACETGRHRLQGGDLLGLSRGFFCAGASALVVSLWPAGDVSTALLMERFYSRLAAGETAVRALHGAQRELRCLEEERDGQRVRPYVHPFYWAPFCLLGVPDVQLVH